MKKICEGVMKKICSIVLLTTILVSCVFTNYSYAGIGGSFLDPILSFISGIGDVVFYTMQHFIVDEDNHNYLRVMEINKADDILRNYAQLTVIDKTKIDGYFVIDEVPEDAEGLVVGPINGGSLINGTLKYPVFKYGLEQIFSDEVDLFDIDFISEPDPDANEKIPAVALRSTITGWYVALRNLAAAGMLCVLVYSGIRILVSSTSRQLDKYKAMLTNWLIGMCLLFFLQYLMLGIVTLSKGLVVMLKENKTEYYVELENMTQNQNGRPMLGTRYFKTNLMGLIRFITQLSAAEGYIIAKISLVCLYLIMVGYTFYFTMVYIKRSINMALLTIAAPIMAFYYPIDKMGDNQAQAFSGWIKNYIYQAMLCPLHLLLYNVFINSSETLLNNPVYIAVALFFFLPTEKFFRKLFGFDKTKEVGASPAAASFSASFLTNALKSAEKKSKKTTKKTKKREVEVPQDEIQGGGPGGNVVVENERQVQSTRELDVGRVAETYGLSEEAYDELIAEGYEPGTDEFDRVASNYAGYNGKGGAQTVEETIDRFGLSEEAYDEIIAEGYEPGTEDFHRYASNFAGYNGKGGVPVLPEPDRFGLSEEAYDEIIAEGYEPGTEEFHRYASNFAGYNGKGGVPIVPEPERFGLSEEAYDEIIAEGYEPGTEEFDMVASNFAGYNGKGGVRTTDISVEEPVLKLEDVVSDVTLSSIDEMVNNISTDTENIELDTERLTGESMAEIFADERPEEILVQPGEDPSLNEALEEGVEADSRQIENSGEPGAQPINISQTMVDRANENNGRVESTGENIAVGQQPDARTQDIDNRQEPERDIQKKSPEANRKAVLKSKKTLSDLRKESALKESKERTERLKSMLNGKKTKYGRKMGQAVKTLALKTGEIAVGVAAGSAGAAVGLIGAAAFPDGKGKTAYPFGGFAAGYALGTKTYRGVTRFVKDLNADIVKEAEEEVKKNLKD